MLPGFRFLFAATMLSVSLLVFGLGAASLFRAAHQAFAISPSWRGGSEVTFAQRGDASPPMLAALRVDPPTLDKAQDEIELTSPSPAPPEPAPLDAEPAPAQFAVVTPVDAQTTEIAGIGGEQAEMPAAQNPPATETSPLPAADITKSDPTKMAALTVADTSPARSEPAIAPPEPSPTQTGPALGIPPAAAEASSKPGDIATLGDPPAEVVRDNPVSEKAARADSAKSDQDAIKKRVRARRAAHRRWLAARARLAAQQFLLQQQADPFTQPWPVITSAPTAPTAPTKRRRITSGPSSPPR